MEENEAIGGVSIKKTILLITLLSTLLGTVSNATASINQKIIPLKYVTSSEEKYAQQIINDIGNPPSNKITVYGQEAYYKPDGSIRLLVIIRNGYKTPIDHLKLFGRYLSVYNHGKATQVAYLPSNGHFDMSDAGILPAGYSWVGWVIYPKQYVDKKHVALDNSKNNLMFSYYTDFD